MTYKNKKIEGSQNLNNTEGVVSVATLNAEVDNRLKAQLSAIISDEFQIDHQFILGECKDAELVSAYVAFFYADNVVKGARKLELQAVAKRKLHGEKQTDVSNLVEQYLVCWSVYKTLHKHVINCKFTADHAVFKLYINHKDRLIKLTGKLWNVDTAVFGFEVDKDINDGTAIRGPKFPKGDIG